MGKKSRRSRIKGGGRGGGGGGAADPRGRPDLVAASDVVPFCVCCESGDRAITPRRTVPAEIDEVFGFKLCKMCKSSYICPDCFGCFSCAVCLDAVYCTACLYKANLLEVGLGDGSLSKEAGSAAEYLLSKLKICNGCAPASGRFSAESISPQIMDVMQARIALQKGSLIAALTCTSCGDFSRTVRNNHERVCFPCVTVRKDMERARAGRVPPVHNVAAIAAPGDLPPLRCVSCFTLTTAGLQINDRVFCMPCAGIRLGQEDFAQVDEAQLKAEMKLLQRDGIGDNIQSPYCGSCGNGSRDRADNVPEVAKKLSYKSCLGCASHICPKCFDDRGVNTCMACKAAYRSSIRELAKVEKDPQKRKQMIDGAAKLDKIVASEEDLRFDCRMMFHRRYREGKCSCCTKEVGGFQVKGTEPTGMRCGDCKAVWYCDATCQKSDWVAHREECAVMKKERDARIAWYARQNRQK